MALVDNITGPNSFDLSRPFRFDGTNFKRWQTKMEFFLTVKKVAHVLKEDIPVVPEEAEKEEREKLAMDIALWNDNDYLCKHFILGTQKEI
ncbi:hypothetical protein Lalb_Chr01g0016571 [Lupinus albus]|uniref:Gag-polypeptide of LTR copia-type n=1 Tax=Lupinus albus TaxID=3870 RepID=A0A6A4R952_LUPAL|nr:hypothetical protein Lalb_Chr01g0016571 [Lupinus albus]